MKKLGLQILKNQDKSRTAEGKSRTKVEIKHHIRGIFKFAAVSGLQCSLSLQCFQFCANSYGKICDIFISPAKFAEF